MNEASLVVLTASDVQRELEGRGHEVVRAVAVARLVLAAASAARRGTWIEQFLPESWTRA